MRSELLLELESLARRTTMGWQRGQEGRRFHQARLALAVRADEELTESGQFDLGGPNVPEMSYGEFF